MSLGTGPQEEFGHTGYLLLALGLILLASATALRIALFTPFNTHPDEVAHADGFCYFESHWVPPPPNAAGLYYAPQGVSRVYYGEVVYIVYGRVTAVIRPWVDTVVQSVRQISQQEDRLVSRSFLPIVLESTRCAYAYRIYRVLNVALYTTTLVVLFYFGRRSTILLALGLLLIAVPQAIYTYAYANSDAWGLSAAIFLFLFALLRYDKGLTRGNVIGLGALTGLVLLSKEPFWVVIPYAYSPPALWLARRMQEVDRSAQRRLLLRLVMVAFVAFLVAAPLRLLVPLAHEDYAARLAEATELHARPPFRPSSPLHPGYMLAKRGYPFSHVATDPAWWRTTVQSTYGIFGYMNVPLPTWSYYSAALLFALMIGGTLFAALRYRARIPASIRVLLWTAPLLIGLNGLASLMNSWIVDFQPQGRYLLPSLIPLAVLLGSTYPYESSRTRTARQLAWAALIAVALYVTWDAILHDPYFRYAA